MPSLWKFSGLTPLRLITLAKRKLGEDELSTRSASLSYYFLVALFPLFLLLVSLIGVFAGPGFQLQENIVSAFGRLAPGSGSEVVRNVVHQTFKSSSGIKLAAGILGALWAASGGMSAVVVSLNKVYRVNETPALVEAEGHDSGPEDSRSHSDCAKCKVQFGDLAKQLRDLTEKLKR
jgi:membrane protein